MKVFHKDVKIQGQGHKVKKYGIGWKVMSRLAKKRIKAFCVIALQESDSLFLIARDNKTINATTLNFICCFDK